MTKALVTAPFISMTAAFCVVWTKEKLAALNSSSLKQASKNGLERTGAMTYGGEKREGNVQPSVYKYKQKRMQFCILLMC